MGGFVPDCHTQTFVEVAKLEFYMALFPKQDGRRQTPWGSMTTCYGDPIWYANITPDIDDLSVIEDAKTIVDACYPQQKSTFFGGHYYCFLTREYLLNLLLFYHDAHKCFPVGQICIVDKWLWSCDAYRATKGWFRSRFWRFLPRQDSFTGGQWINLPSLDDAIKFLEPQKVINPVVSAEQRVAEFEKRMNYKAQPLSDEAQDRLDTKFHYSHQMRRWVE